GRWGVVALWLRSAWRIALVTCLWLLTLGAIAWGAFHTSWWIPPATPAVAYVPAGVLAMSYVSSQERSMRALLMKLYSGHVSKEIAELTWANRSSFLDGRRPLAQRVTVTVLFADLKGFSTIS